MNKLKGKGTLVSITPKMKGGQHNSFTNQHGTFYNHLAVFKTDKNPKFELNISSKEQVTKWKVGEEYEFEASKIEGSSPSGQYSFWNGKILQDKKWTKPDSRDDGILAQTCIKAASDYFSNRSCNGWSDVKEMAEHMFEWAKSKR